MKLKKYAFVFLATLTILLLTACQKEQRPTSAPTASVDNNVSLTPTATSAPINWTPSSTPTPVGYAPATNSPTPTATPEPTLFPTSMPLMSLDYEKKINEKEQSALEKYGVDKTYDTYEAKYNFYNTDNFNYGYCIIKYDVITGQVLSSLQAYLYEKPAFSAEAEISNGKIGYKIDVLGKKYTTEPISCVTAAESGGYTLWANDYIDFLNYSVTNNCFGYILRVYTEGDNVNFFTCTSEFDNQTFSFCNMTENENEAVLIVSNDYYGLPLPAGYYDFDVDPRNIPAEKNPLTISYKNTKDTGKNFFINRVYNLKGEWLYEQNKDGDFVDKEGRICISKDSYEAGSANQAILDDIYWKIRNADLLTTIKK